MTEQVNQEQPVKKIKRLRHSRLYDLLYIIRNHEKSRRRYDAMGQLASALIIACKNTKMQKDAHALIEVIPPPYMIIFPSNDEQLLTKRNRSRPSKLFNLLYDVRQQQANLNFYEKMAFFAYALTIACEGTKMEQDAKSIIEIVYPSYYAEK
jgi:hypothetical protein